MQIAGLMTGLIKIDMNIGHIAVVGAQIIIKLTIYTVKTMSSLLEIMIVLVKVQQLMLQMITI